MSALRAVSPPTVRPTAVTPLAGRVLAGCLSSGCLTVLSLAAWMNPSDDGHGTHTQLGLPPCYWAQTLEKPCVTCGMTTSFSHAAHGDLLGSLTAQPFGALLAVLTATGVWGGLWVAATGANLNSVMGRLARGRTFWIGLVLLLGAWAYKFLTWDS